MPVLMMGGAGTAGSDECTASRAKVLEGFTAITSDSDDELATGTLAFNGTALATDVFPNKTFYNTNPLTRLVGALAPNAISGLTATNYATGTCVLSWTRPKSKWSGVLVGYKRDSYPTSISDSTATWFETSDSNRTINVSVGYTYKFRAWNYLETSAGRIYGGYSDVSFYAPNNAGDVTYKGSGTWTVPAGVHSIDIFGVGGGGGGNGGGGKNSGRGGGGGGYTKTVTGISVTPYQVLTIHIGGGGTGGTSTATPTDGGETYVANANKTKLFSVSGGKAGSVNNGGAGGSGGGAAGVYRGDSYDTAGTNGASNGQSAKTNSYKTGSSHWVYYYGGAGQGTTTGEWGNTNNTKYGGGGGGGGRAGGSTPYDTSRYGGGSGGEGGGGKGASKLAESGGNGGANTGGGGGGGFCSDGAEATSNGGNGGSGILKIRWK